MPIKEIPGVLDSDDIEALNDLAKEDKVGARQYARDLAGTPGQKTIEIHDANTGEQISVPVHTIGQTAFIKTSTPFKDPAYEQASRDNWRSSSDK